VHDLRSTLRVGIDANSILGDRGGVGWYTYDLLRALVELKQDAEIVAYVRPGARRRLDAGLLAWERAARFRWVEAGRMMMRWRGTLDRLDLYHGTNYRMQTVGRFGGVVTIYDLWLDRAPQYSRKLLGQRASHYRTRRTAWRACRVITISEHSARDIASLHGLPRDRIVVIPCGVSEEFRPTPDPRALSELTRRLAVPTEHFLLFVGGADPRKNHGTFLQAFARCVARLPGHSVILVGDQVHRFGDMRETVRTLGLDRRVVCAGIVPMTDLRLLYSHADLFVFPSVYEGFGMPVLEAMACGAPVITSNRTALPEVAGDAAVLVNPEDAEELAEAIIRVLEDSALRDSLRAKGFERVKQFSWERAAHQTMAVYREVCEEGS
jgi:glycosyltransferase involved in cell wall biosynthesis